MESVSAQILREQAAVVDRVFNDRLARQQANDKAEIARLREHVACLKSLVVDGGRFKDSEGPPPEALLDSFDVDGIGEYIRTNGCKNIVVMCGAGISTSAGIPDFRTPGTGLYDNLQKYDLPEPMSVFTLDYFRHSPNAFYMLAEEMWPDAYAPTPAHHFIAELHQRGMLLRCYTQNIDSLETRAGLPAEKIVAAHGNFDTCSTIGTLDDEGRVIPGSQHVVPLEEVRSAIKNGTDTETGWPALLRKYGSLCKPDITFFGEPLPARFFELRDADLLNADLLIVMGTSLQVSPFNGLIRRVQPRVPRLLINREEVGGPPQPLVDVGLSMVGSTDLDFRPGTNYRDAIFRGTCDDGVKALAAALDWGDALVKRMRSGQASIVPKPAAKPMGKPAWAGGGPPKRKWSAGE